MLSTTVAWISPTSGDWNVASNWNSDQVPGPNDDVVINVPGASPTITIDSGNQSVHSLTATDSLVISGGSLTLAASSEIDGSLTYSDSNALTTGGTLTLKGATTWSAGTFGGTGTIDNASGATLTIAGGVSLTGALNNDGTIDQTTGPLYVDAGALATNELDGTFNIEFDGQFLSGDGDGTLENLGTLTKTAGTAASTVDQYFVNDGGTIEVQSGSLDLGWASYAGTTTLTAAQGASIDLGFTQGGGVAGEGTITGSLIGSGAGSVQLSQSVTVGSAGATLDFPGNPFLWTAGTITSNAGGTLTNQAGGAMTIAGPVGLLGALDNYGTIDQTGGPFYVHSGALAINEPVGTYNIGFDGQFLNGDGSGTLENLGTLAKTAGTGASTVDQFFVNDGGTIEVQSGSLDLGWASYAGTSTFTVAAGSLIDLGFTQSGGVAGDGTITGTLTGSGAGTVQVSQSVTVGSAGATLDFPANPFLWTGGTITVSPGGTLTSQAGTTLTITGQVGLLGALDNDGMIDQTGGPLVVDSGALATNEAGGTYDIEFDGQFLSGGGSGTLENLGTLAKTAGTGASTVDQYFVNDNGTIEVQSGSLDLGWASYAGTSTVTALQGTLIDLGFTAGGGVVGDGTISGTLTGSGAGIVQLSQNVTVGAGATVDFAESYFQFTGGTTTLNAGATVTLNATTTWSGGAFGGTGTIDNASGATLTITGGVSLTSDLNNDGTIDQTAGPLNVNTASLANNEPDGTYDIEYDGQFLSGSGNGTLENQGTLVKTAGTGASTVAQFFVNDGGTIVAQSGSLDLDYASYAGTSTLTVAQGALIDLGFTQGGGVAGDGMITGTLIGSGAGTVQLSQSVTVGSAGATLDFPGTHLQWTGGIITVSPGGTLTNQAGTTVTIADPVGLLGAFDNYGTIDQTGGPFYIHSGAQAINEPVGTYNIGFDGQFLNGDGSGTLENLGTLAKTAGTGASTVDQFFVNDNGTIVAQSGTLDLGWASYNGTSTVTALQGTLIDLGFTQGGGVAGTGTIAGILDGSGAGIVQLSQSVSVGAQGLVVDFTGAPFQWISGTITPLGTGEVTNVAGSSMTIAAGGGQELIGDLINAGTITQTGTGQVNITPGSLTNEAGAVYDIQNTSLRVSVLNNSGLFEKSTGSGTSQIGNEVDNTGTIEVDSGSLAFFTNGPPKVDQVSGNTLTAGTWIVNDGATLSLPVGTNITTNQAAITLDGSGSTFTSIQNLATSTGLTLTGGASFTTTGNFSDAGTLTLGAGSTFSVTGKYTQESSATLDVQLGGAPSSWAVRTSRGHGLGRARRYVPVRAGRRLRAHGRRQLRGGELRRRDRRLRRHQCAALPRRQPVPDPDQSYQHQLRRRDIGRRAGSHHRHRQPRPGADRPGPDRELLGAEPGQCHSGEFVGGLGVPVHQRHDQCLGRIAEPRDALGCRRRRRQLHGEPDGGRAPGPAREL